MHAGGLEKVSEPQHSHDRHMCATKMVERMCVEGYRAHICLYSFYVYVIS
jgi:hypothetical protein